MPADPRSHRILVVDDNEAIHRDFRKILGIDEAGADFDAAEAAFFGADAAGAGAATSFQLDFASQGREALEMATAARREGAPYELIFMDVRMPPGWDGIETTARIWEVDADVQVVICTAYSDYSWEEMLARLGGTDRLLILKKPFDTIEVVQLAHSLTAKWRLLQAARKQAESLENAVRERTRELEATNSRLALEIAERKRGQDALQLTQFSVDHASDAMFWIGPDGRILYANAATCRPLGYTADALIGQPATVILPELTSGDWADFWQSLPGEPRRTFESWQLAWDQRRIPVELTLNYFNLGERKILCACARDITRRVEILKELSSARDAALESVRLKGQFLANMSHEIRTPMNGVVGMAELLLHTNLDRDQRDYVDTIRSSADLLLGIINDILDSAKIDSGKMQFASRHFDLRETVESALDVVAPTARKKGLELAGCVPPADCNYLVGDAGRLQQVLANLLGNAVKFTAAGEVTLLVSRVGEAAAGPISLRFEIHDTGAGIDALSQERIFEAFHQADGSNTRKHGGTGLGLTICRQIVEAMGGEIGFHSSPGAGSTFWFSLPFAISAERPAPAREIPRGMRILVVDDNETNRHILRLQLINLLQRPEAVPGATAALAALRTAAADGDPFPLAIVDMQMPETDGLALARAIRADSAFAATRIVLLSSLGEPLAAEEMTALGIAEHIVKPVKHSRLQSTLAELATVGSPAPAHVPAAAPAAVSEAKSLRVLLAEDNPVNQKVALLQLRNLGYSADVARDGAEAVAAFAKAPYDVVLMDCQMPVMDGFAATRRLRELYDRPIRIVAMTANAMAGDREKCLAAGMDDYLSKPVNPAELRRVLENCQPPAAAEIPAPPPAEAPAVELDRLREITGHHPEMFRTICRDYIEQADEIMSLMVLAIQRRDAPALRLQAHKLGGSSASCGMTAIVPALNRLERMGESGQLASAEDIHYQAARQLHRIRIFLARINESSNTLPTPSCQES